MPCTQPALTMEKSTVTVGFTCDFSMGQDEEEGEPSGDEDRSDHAGKQSVHYKGIVLDVETKVDENEHENACGYCLLCCMMYELCIYIYIYFVYSCKCGLKPHNKGSKWWFRIRGSSQGSLYIIAS